MTTPSAVETAEETTMDPPGRSSATVQASGHEPIAEPPEEEIAQPSAVETTMDPAGKSSATDQASGNERMTPMTGASEGMVKPSKEELMALRSDLGKFLLAYDAHVNDDSDNFGYDRNAHSRFPRPWAVANELAKVFQHAYKIDVNADAWDEVFESEELRRTLKTVEDVEADMRESLPLSATRKNKLRRLLELQMYIRMVMTAQHQNFGWDVLEEAGQWSERDEITPMDRMTDDIRMLAQLALSYIIPQAEFSEWLEEVAVNGYGHSLQVQLSQHTFDNNAVLPVTMRGGNSGEPSFPRNSYRTPPRAKRGGNDCPSESHHQPTDGNDYPSQSYQTPRPSPRKRSKNVTHSNPLPKKKPNHKNRSKERERGTTTKQATPPYNGQGNGNKSAKRVSPNIANDGYDVGGSSPKKKSKNNNRCGLSGSESKDSEMMDVRGVERQVYSKEAPGKSPVVHSSKNHEDGDPCGRPRSSGKQNNRHKNRTQERERDAYNKVEKNQKTTNRKGTGSRKVLNKSPKLCQGEPNDRTCQAVAICALLEEHRRHIVYSDLIKEMPPEGDTTVASANIALARHGLKLQSVYGLFRKKDGVPFNLMKLRQCRLVLHLKLVTLQGKQAFHSIAWDGQTVWDGKECVKVNATTDRRTAHAAIAVFNHLYHHKRFKSWHIDNVFELVDKETPPFRNSAGSEQSILKHSNPLMHP